LRERLHTLSAIGIAYLLLFVVIRWTLQQNRSLLSRFIGTVKESWSRRSSAAVGTPSRDDQREVRGTRPTVVRQSLQPHVSQRDLTYRNGSPDGHCHSIELQRIHRQLVEKLEPLMSESEFSARRYALFSHVLPCQSRSFPNRQKYRQECLNDGQDDIRCHMLICSI